MKNSFGSSIGLLLLSIVSCIFSVCCHGGVAPVKERSRKKEGVVAIVYVDLTGSINEEIATRVKENIGKLFKNLPAETKFYLYSINGGASNPDIYNFVPTIIAITDIKVASDETKRENQIKESEMLKETTEFEKLNNALNTYQTLISNQKGPVSCLTNRLDSLWEIVKNKRDSNPNYEVRVYFYSDMIEECNNSFDGKPLDFKRKANEIEEEKQFQEILRRVEKGFPANPLNDLKSLGAKIHIVSTSHTDRQNLRQLKMIWAKIFEKNGYTAEDINNKDYFYWGDGTDEIIWDFRR